jgi:hypothetical protein
MAILELLKATVGTGADAKAYYFLGRADVYTNISAATGITEATEDEQDEPATSVGELLGAGVLLRLAATIGTEGGSDNKQVKFLCTKAKFSTAFDDIVGSTIREQEVLTVRVPRKATFF